MRDMLTKEPAKANKFYNSMYRAREFTKFSSVSTLQLKQSRSLALCVYSNSLLIYVLAIMLCNTYVLLYITFSFDSPGIVIAIYTLMLTIMLLNIGWIRK